MRDIKNTNNLNVNDCRIAGTTEQERLQHESFLFGYEKCWSAITCITCVSPCFQKSLTNQIVLNHIKYKRNSKLVEKKVLLFPCIKSPNKKSHTKKINFKSFVKGFGSN